MRVGDLVRINEEYRSSIPDYWHRRKGFSGVVLLDYSPIRPEGVGRVVDVMWENGDIEDMYSDDLEVLNDQVA